MASSAATVAIQSSTLRPYPSQNSPAASASSHTTTPTSPHFSNIHYAQHLSQGGQPTVHHSSRGQTQYTNTHPHSRSNMSLDHPYQSSTTTSHPIIQHPARPPTPTLLHPPSGMSFSSHLKTWGNNEIETFLGIYKCAHYAPVFQKNDIDGKVILELDMASLKEMGVNKVGERVKLLTGIKDLRKRASGHNLLTRSRVELRLNGSATPPLDDSRSPRLSPSIDSSRLVTPYDRQGGAVTASRRLHTTRPPPLDLQQHQASSRNLPQAYQGGGNLSAGSHSNTITPRPGASHSTQPSGRPGLNVTSTSTANATGTGLVPAPSSVPRPNNSNLRAPPARELGRRSPGPINGDSANFADRPLPPAPTYSQQQQQQQSSAASYASSITQRQLQSGDHTSTTPTWANTDQLYGLPKGPAPPGPLPNVAGRGGAGVSIGTSANTHRKHPSTNTPVGKSVSPVKSKFGTPVRPPNVSSNSTGSIHPFAFHRRPDDDKRESSPPQETNQAGMKRDASGGSLSSQTAGSAVMTQSSSNQNRPRRTAQQGGEASASIPLEDLRRQLVKFINADDGTSRTVNVATCTSGVDVLERVLRKFGKWKTGTAVSNGTDTESDEDGERLEVDGWGVYAEPDPNDDSKPLSEARLLAICAAHRDGTAIRDQGLTLRRTRQLQNRKNMESFLGEAPPPPMSPMSPTSPTYYGGPQLGIASQSDAAKASSVKRMNRASTVSIMSGLGVPVQQQDTPPSPGSTSRSPSSGSFLGSRGKKMYNFFGHRPPSELISNHLQEYFPSVKKRELEKTARQSMLRVNSGQFGSTKRLSNAGSISSRPSLEGPPVPTDKSSAYNSPRRTRPPSTRGVASPPPAATIPEEEESLPRVSVSTDGGQIVRPSIDGESEDESVASVESRPPLLPPFVPSKESLSDSLSAYSPLPRPNRPRSIVLARRNSGGSTKSRMSTLSQLRRNRDRSDNVSMLTVDEITAEVENRRASTITFEESDEESEEAVVTPVVPAAVDPGSVPTSEVEESEGDDESEEESEDEDSEDDDEDDEEEEVEEEHGKAYTSTGSKRSIKWIKGALIGAGSFGSVYLGMDAHSGLLMAVKQVELPVGNSKNEERKRSMVDALEREIELLKELQHENIVQYLDSSTDAAHLNIFLEYVPGGSVAALLNNYGAFEEALVKNFVRQILTGLNYLHEREIIHRDIKGANILVDNKGGIKISDFGISKKVENNLMNASRANRPSLQGSVFWMAPEIVKQTSYTSKADIWSVGCLVVEMLTGTHPWADLNQMQAMYRIGSSAKPAIPSDISSEAAEFLQKTFELDYQARPTASQLLQQAFIVQKSLDGDGGRGKQPGQPQRGSDGLISAVDARANMQVAAAQRIGMQSQTVATK